MRRGKHGLNDTRREAERVQIELLRRAPAWRKMQMVDDLNRAVKRLALCGLRERHPGASEEELRRRLADLLLGPDLAARAYGPPPWDRGDDACARPASWAWRRCLTER